MAIQYSGTNINTTFTCTTGSRQEIVTGIENALVSAGWTVISGSGTANVLLESATTPNPQNLVCRVQVQDTGSGQCAQIRFRNQGNTKAQANQFFLYTSAARVYRVIANPYQFFVFSSDSLTVGRTFVCGGVPYLPSFLQGVITECIWCHGNMINSDTDATKRASFRTDSIVLYDQQQSTSWQLCNGNMWETYGTWYVGAAINGGQELMVQMGAKVTTQSGVPAYRWHDGSVLTYEPLIAWGLVGYSDEPMIRGQLWDAALVSGQFVADQTTTFDANNWWVLTNNVTWNGGTCQGATLMLVVP